MPTRRSCVSKPLVALLLCVASLAWADESAGIRFTVPDDWQSTDLKGSRVLAPEGLQKGDVLLAIVAGAQASTGATPASQLAELAAAANEGVQITGNSEVVETDRGETGNLYIQNFNAVGNDLGDHHRMVVMLLRGNRRGAVIVLISSSRVLAAHQEGFQSLLKSLELTGALAPVRAPVAGPATRPVASKPRPESAAPSSGRLPTGNTPTLFPGMPGWLPSGRGVKIPVARVVGGRPEGLWWRAQVQARGGMTAERIIFLADGTRATNPRPGGGELFDVEGQRAQQGTTGVGTFTVAGGQITQAYDGFTNTNPISSGSDRDGLWLDIGRQRYRALSPPSAKTLVGTWTTAGGKYLFRADGTYEMGQVHSTDAIVAAAGTRGTWQLDGYLLAIRPDNAPFWIATVGATLKGSLVIGTRLFTRQ